jgi:hypothetical protein
MNYHGVIDIHKISNGNIAGCGVAAQIENGQKTSVFQIYERIAENLGENKVKKYKVKMGERRDGETTILL